MIDPGCHTRYQLVDWCAEESAHVCHIGVSDRTDHSCVCDCRRDRGRGRGRVDGRVERGGGRDRMIAAEQ